MTVQGAVFNQVNTVLGVKQYGSSPYCILPSNVLQYIAILQYMTRLCSKPFHGNILYTTVHVLCS